MQLNIIHNEEADPLSYFNMASNLVMDGVQGWGQSLDLPHGLAPWTHPQGEPAFTQNRLGGLRSLKDIGCQGGARDDLGRSQEDRQSEEPAAAVENTPYLAGALPEAASSRECWGKPWSSTVAPAIPVSPCLGLSTRDRCGGRASRKEVKGQASQAKSTRRRQDSGRG
uniref:Uncharacterized protein n=1 Tax=Sphaerodactylus townsendi TaxID=933632 RepID=A0ACB8G3H7_9SAUR